MNFLEPAMRRRTLLLGAGTWLLASAARAGAEPTADDLIRDAERALRAEQPAAAAGLFERASRLDDVSATAELGMMRAYLQAGDYAHALAWGRLVAGEHPQSPEAEAWADAVDALVRGPRAGAPAHGLPPLPGPAVDATAFHAARARRIGCGLVDGPRQRLLVAPALARHLGEGALPWVVDGTGATWRMTDADGRLQRVSAPGAEPAASSLAASPVPARARPGRPVLVMRPAADGGWPTLLATLTTFPAAGDDRLALAMAAGAAPEGSPVFDACGAWLGWTDQGRLEPAPAAHDDGAGCRAGPGGNVAAIYGQWYAVTATVWRPA